GRRGLVWRQENLLREMFGLLVRMYAYEDTLQDMQRLAYKEPYCLEFYAPQLASFLVWNSYYTGGQLEAWLLARCSESFRFAHALNFQLRAFCLPPPALGNPDRYGSGGSSTSRSSGPPESG
ncbi:unnamed protein product, partial [Discosporangium mesarthrocarpum]